LFIEVLLGCLKVSPPRRSATPRYKEWREVGGKGEGRLKRNKRRETREERREKRKENRNTIDDSAVIDTSAGACVQV